ncbi:hypothetical protein NDU88_004629 [Pleurodeles waltl]|uniref:Uncharacterized protein n=1 Tax=Pleurodeles waltl TaxID=8319 RepID=A0AAV7LKI1_PLEWA|nr:hypothetical protein NDU88_004629 [Pleurodeles waltl]
MGVCVCGLLDRRKGFLLFEVSPALRARKNTTGRKKSGCPGEASVAEERQHSTPGMLVGRRGPRKQLRQLSARSETRLRWWERKKGG